MNPKQIPIGLSMGSSELAHLGNIVAAAEQLTVVGQTRLADALASFWRQLKPSRFPYLVPAPSERIDVRRTLREFIRGGGVLTRLSYHRKLRAKRLVIIFDCSESNIKAGQLVLLSALLRVDPKVTVLGFDSELFSLPGRVTSPAELGRMLAARSTVIRTRGERWLGLIDLPRILQATSRYVSATAQSYLLLVSDLFVADRPLWDESRLHNAAMLLRRYKKVWLMDTWPMGAEFAEAEDGAVTGTMEGLDIVLGRRRHELRDVKFRQAESTQEYSLSASILARLRQIGKPGVLFEAWRFTPLVRQLGFVNNDAATGSSRLVYVPHIRPQDVGDVFREVFEPQPL